MTLAEAVKAAVQAGDAKMAGSVADQLRSRGFNYQSVYAFAHRNTGVTPEAWEDLMYAADGDSE